MTYLLADPRFGLYHRTCTGCSRHFKTPHPEVVDLCGHCEGKMTPETRRNWKVARVRKHLAENIEDEVDADECLSVISPEEKAAWERKGVSFHDRQRWT